MGLVVLDGVGWCWMVLVIALTIAKAGYSKCPASSVGCVGSVGENNNRYECSSVNMV